MLAQIQALDTQIHSLSQQIKATKKTLDAANDTVVEDVCLDEIEANKAALEVMRGICIDAMLDTDPQGEA